MYYNNIQQTVFKRVRVFDLCSFMAYSISALSSLIVHTYIYLCTHIDSSSRLLLLKQLFVWLLLLLLLANFHGKHEKWLKKRPLAAAQTTHKTHTQYGFLFPWLLLSLSLSFSVCLSFLRSSTQAIRAISE